MQGFCPLNTIEQTLSSLIDERASKGVQRIATVMKAEEAVAMLEPGDFLIDCSGSNSLLRDHLAAGSAIGQAGANTLNIQLEYAVVITFLYGQPYLCNEYCKYNKNVGNLKYKFIPAVDRIAYDGDISHVTGIVNITRRGLRGHAAKIRRCSGCAATFPSSPSRWSASSTRSKRKHRERSSATSRSCGSP